jgi:DNA-directed RNA polymerase subunit RPC12/RpoP
LEALVGNAIAGDLLDHFGFDMTDADGTCRHCGATARVAELVVYTRAPGSVARCPACGNVVMVLVTIRDRVRVDHAHFRLA